MSSVEDALRTAVTELRRLRANFALVGGLAVSIRTEPRFTRDVDCAVAVANDVEAERLVSGLLALQWRPAAQIEHEVARRLATMRLFPPGESGAVVDLLFATSGIEAEIVDQADEVAILRDLRCKVARVGHLVALKLLARDDARRPQDRADLIALLRVALPTELDVARQSLLLIGQRGFARGKNLADEFSRLRSEVDSR